MNCAFPSKIGGGPSRWCLGDLSIAVALLAASEAFEHRQWYDTALESALTASEHPTEFSGVIDAGLCHGAAGVGHVFNRLHGKTMQMPPGGIAGFSAWTYSEALG
jgi:hypothetical protein